MSGLLTISQLEVGCLIGIYEDEKKHPQKLLLNIQISGDFSRACTEDNIRGTVDYDSIAERLEKLATSRHFQLIEHFAFTACELIMQEFSLVEHVNIEVRKKAIAQADYCGFSFEMKRGQQRFTG